MRENLNLFSYFVSLFSFVRVKNYVNKFVSFCVKSAHKFEIGFRCAHFCCLTMSWHRSRLQRCKKPNNYHLFNKNFLPFTHILLHKIDIQLPTYQDKTRAFQKLAKVNKNICIKPWTNWSNHKRTAHPNR